MAPPNSRSRAKTQRSTPLTELFRPYGIPPSPLHEALQNAATQAGWISPWDSEEQRAKKSEAGKKSGISRAGRAQIRLSLLNRARARLTPEERRSPYSEASLNALEATYQNLLREDVSGSDILASIMLSVVSETDLKSLEKTSRETLKKDLKAIRKMRGVKR
jgi:hypothetical protein